MKPISLPVVNDVIDAMQQFPFQNIVAEVMDDVYMHYHDEKLLDIFSFGKPTNYTRGHSSIFTRSIRRACLFKPMKSSRSNPHVILVKYMQK